MELKNRFEDNRQVAIAQHIKTHFGKNSPVSALYQTPRSLNLTKNSITGNKIDYKNFLKTIPDFDGTKDGYPMESFTKACKNAIKLFKDEIDEEFLVNIFKDNFYSID